MQLTTQQIETVVHARIRDFLTERGLASLQFDASTRLNDGLGLTSLDLAVLVIELEAALGVDPFAKLVPVTSVRSVGDVIEAYRLAAAGEQSQPDPGLVAAAERAMRRRGRRGV